SLREPPGRYSDGAPEPPPPPSRQGPPSGDGSKERREALARKLGGLRSVPPQRRAGQSVPPASGVHRLGPTSSPEAAVQTLKARYEGALAEAKRTQIARYTDLGKTSLERKDYASAANAYRIAASLAPDDPEIQRVSSEAQRLAAAALADGYLKQ